MKKNVICHSEGNQTANFSLTNYSTYPDEQLLLLLRNNDDNAFREIYTRYQERLSANAIKITGNLDDANDIVQELFINLWNKRSELLIRTSLSAYLDASIRYACFRQLRRADHNNAKLKALVDYLHENILQPDLATKELEQKIDTIIKMMPERTREVFILSRHYHLSHREISEKLEIAEDTSRQHIKNALRFVRQQLNILSALFTLLLFIRL